MRPFLCFDSSTRTVVVAVWHEGRLLGEERVSGLGTATTTLLPAIDSLTRRLGLKPSEYGAVAAGLGPGYLTGLRVGVTTAIALASRLQVPLVPLNTLEVIAMNLPGRTEEVAVVTDALKGQCYWGVYAFEHGLPVLRKGFACDGPEQAAQALFSHGPMAATGDGLVRYRDAFGSLLETTLREVPEAAAPTGTGLGELAAHLLAGGRTRDPLTVEPIYLRAPDAKVNPAGVIWDAGARLPGLKPGSGEP